MNQILRMVLVLVVGLGAGYLLLGPPSPQALVLGAVLGIVAVFVARWLRTRSR